MRTTDRNDSSVVTPQIITDLQAVHATRPAQQGKGARRIGKGADHFKLLDVETFEVLPDPVRVGFDVARTPPMGRQISTDLW
ncbi:hypothetical protein D3C85_1321110 [compost metagenome]